MARLAVLFVGAIALTAAFACAEEFYLTESGGGTGVSCTSPRSAAWFNSAANWANPKLSGRIGPGDTVHLCGEIATGLRFQGSGSNGSYITVDGQGATLGSAFSFSTNAVSWWRIQNAVWRDGATTNLLAVTGGSNGVFTAARADNVSWAPLIWLGQYNGLPNNIVISNSYLRTGAADYGDTQHDIIMTEGSTNVFVEGNYLEMRAGGAGPQAHNDIIQAYEKGGSSAGNPSNWTIRDNWLVMNSAATNDRSWLMLERLAGTNYIYGNVFLGVRGAESANGIACGLLSNSDVLNIFNNTFVAKNGASNNVLNLGLPGKAYVTNNIFHLQGQTALTGTMPIVRSHNLWFGTNTPSCSGLPTEICGQDPQFVNYTANEFSLRRTSPAFASGTNLGAPPAGHIYDRGIAAYSTWPNPSRVTRATNWDRGAYQNQSSDTLAPAPPTDLKGVGGN